KGKTSQSTIIVNLASDAELFHSPAGTAYATIDVNGHRETMPVRSKTFKQWLAGTFYRATKKAAGAQAIQDALAVLEAKAVFDGQEHTVHVRLAEHNGSYYLDLVNETWPSINVTPEGWTVVDNPPVKFIRFNGMLTLPTPKTGGDINALRDFINVSPDNKDGTPSHEWVLLTSYILATMRPQGPYSILVLQGEQGSAK